MKKNQSIPNVPLWKKNRSLHFAAGLILSLTLVVTAFEWNFPDALTDRPIDDLNNKTIIDQPIMEPVVLPTPPRPKVPVTVIPVPDDTPLSTEEKEPEIEPDPVEPAEPTDLGTLFLEDEPIDTATEVIDYETFPAEPVGGKEAFYQYLYKHIRYPDHLTGRGITGKVFVSFEVDKSGKISNVKILKGFDSKLEKEIIRVLEKAPEWIPAQQGKNKVTTRHTIPFSFRID